MAAPRLRRHAKALDEPLSRYMLARLRALSKSKQTFEFTVHAHLSVQAIDEDAARRKLDGAFGQPHVLDTDVRTTGDVSISPSGK